MIRSFWWALLLVGSAHAADKVWGNFTLDHGNVSDGKTVVMTVTSQFPDGLTEGHQVTAPGKGVVFAVNMMKSNGSKLASVEFPSLNRTFEARFPMETTLPKLLGSFLKTGVIVGNQPNLAALTTWCAQLGIVLKDTRALMAREAAAAQRAECGRCRDEYRACQVQRAETRKHPRPGVTVEANCERSFRACSFGGASARRPPV